MSYEEWLKDLETLKKSNDQEIKEKLLKEEKNEALSNLLEPKIISLLDEKFEITTRKVIKNLYEMFIDNNMLDLYLVNFKKELKFIDELTYIKQISESNQEKIRKDLMGKANAIYNILIDEANQLDGIGLLELTIKNNMYKWSGENEL